MEAQKKKPGIMPKLQKAKAKLLASYYSHPAKDLKVILIVGNTGRSQTAHYLQETLRISLDPKAGLIIDPSSTGDFYKQLSGIWRSGANHLIITATSNAIANNIFYQLPVFMTINVDLANDAPLSVLTSNNAENDAKAFLSSLQPEFNILSCDNPSYQEIAAYPVKNACLSYGKDREANLRIVRSKLYKKGTEATLAYGKDNFDTATYLTGEDSVDYMAATAIAAIAFGLSYTDITDGIANYEP